MKADSPLRELLPLWKINQKLDPKPANAIPLTIVLDPDNIVPARLNLDQLKRDLSGILQPVPQS